MQLVEECFNCILNRCQGILERKNINIKLQSHIQNLIYLKNNSLMLQDSWLSNNIQKICPAQLGSNRQYILESNQLGDTYQEEKRMGNEVGSYFWEKLKTKKMSMEISLLHSLFGNGIEFDVGGNYNSISQDKMKNELNKILQDPVLKNAAKQVALFISTNLAQGDLALILMDNVGENYLDALLIQTLLESGIKVEIVVKGYPILNDVTRSDMEGYPLDVKIWDTRCSDVGLFINRIPKSLRNRMNEADLIIIKGMAQFETLSSEILPTDAIYLMKVKCVPVANAINSELGRYVIHYQNRNKAWL